MDRKWLVDLLACIPLTYLIIEKRQTSCQNRQRITITYTLLSLLGGKLSYCNLREPVNWVYRPGRSPIHVVSPRDRGWKSNNKEDISSKNSSFRAPQLPMNKGQSDLSAADVKMEIPALVRTLKSSILSSTSFQMGKTFWGVVSAAVEQSRRKADMVAQGDGKFGPWGWPQGPSKPKKVPIRKNLRYPNECYIFLFRVLGKNINESVLYISIKMT